MKRIALFAAALATATPAVADGYLGLQYGSSEIDGGGPSTDLDVWAGEGAFGWSGSGWGGQVDGSFGNADAGTSGDLDFYTFGGHVWWTVGAWRLGGVITTTNVDPGGASSDIDELSYGVEGTWDFSSNARLVSSLTTGNVEQGSSDLDTFNWDAGVDFFPSPNIRIGGFFGIGNLEDSAGDVDTSSFGVNGEFQPWSAPVSITVAWNSWELDDVGGVESNTFQVGARWNFGGGTLQERSNATPFDTNTGFANRLFGVW